MVVYLRVQGEWVFVGGSNRDLVQIATGYVKDLSVARFIGVLALAFHVRNSVFETYRIHALIFRTSGTNRGIFV
jgi:hypothetical protein